VRDSDWMRLCRAVLSTVEGVVGRAMRCMVVCRGRVVAVVQSGGSVRDGGWVCFRHSELFVVEEEEWLAVQRGAQWFVCEDALCVEVVMHGEEGRLSQRSEDETAV
jgi:hypothetical protein